MSELVTKDIIEQSAIFDGEPDFPPLSMAIYLMNHYAYGGTPEHFKEAKKELDNPKRYRVRLTLEYEEIDSKQGGR